MQLLTFKVKHGRDFSDELAKARKVAEFALRTRTRSSKDVKHLGLKSAIANQILRKYSNDRRAKRISKVVLTVPGQAIKINKHQKHISIVCLQLKLQYRFRNDFQKVNQIEIDNQYAYITVSVQESPGFQIEQSVGVDRNTTGHCAVVAFPYTGKVWKLGKQAKHVHKIYEKIRQKLHKLGKHGAAKNILDRESRIIRDLNHKLSHKIVHIAITNACGIKMENLEGIRNNRKNVRQFRYSLNSWSFHQLQRMVEYKAKLQGVAVAYVEPAYTSKTCSRCGLLGDRNGKRFRCPSCGHVEDADVNAAFNIALRPISVPRSGADRDAPEGSTDTPQVATPQTQTTTEPHRL